MWLLFAILSSVFAALTSILAKVGQFQSRHCHPHGGRAGHVMGNGVPDECAERFWGYIAEELAFPDPLRACHRSLLAVLLQGSSDGGGFKGRSNRQVERSDYTGVGVCVPS